MTCSLKMKLNNTAKWILILLLSLLVVHSVAAGKMSSYSQQDSLNYKDSVQSYSPSYRHGNKEQQSFSSSSYPHDLMYQKVFTEDEASQLFRSAGCVNDEIKV